MVQGRWNVVACMAAQTRLSEPRSKRGYCAQHLLNVLQEQLAHGSARILAPAMLHFIDQNVFAFNRVRIWCTIHKVASAACRRTLAVQWPLCHLRLCTRPPRFQSFNSCYCVIQVRVDAVSSSLWTVASEELCVCDPCQLSDKVLCRWILIQCSRQTLSHRHACRSVCGRTGAPLRGVQRTKGPPLAEKSDTLKLSAL